MDELAMNLTPNRVDDGYLKVLIVAKATVAKMLRERAAMGNRVGIRHKFDPRSISKGNAVFHIEKKFLHCRTSGWLQQ
jgi:hypothetical protein